METQVTVNTEFEEFVIRCLERESWEPVANLFAYPAFDIGITATLNVYRNKDSGEILGDIGFTDLIIGWSGNQKDIDKVYPIFRAKMEEENIPAPTRLVSNFFQRIEPQRTFQIPAN